MIGFEFDGYYMRRCPQIAFLLIKQSIRTDMKLKITFSCQKKDDICFEFQDLLFIKIMLTNGKYRNS